MNQSVECSISAQFFSGYNVVVLIPAGATNIDVRQHSFSGKSEDDNYLGEMGALPFVGILVPFPCTMWRAFRFHIFS